MPNGEQGVSQNGVHKGNGNGNGVHSIMQEEFSADTPIGKFKARGSDILGIITLCCVFVLMYGGWTHTVDAKDDRQEFVKAIKESIDVQREMAAAQREANCLNRLTPEEKRNQREIEFCRQLGRGR